MRGELWILNWAQAKVAEYLEASMWLAPTGDNNKGHVSIVPIEGKGTISDKELGERIASTRKEWNNCSKL